MSELTPVKRAVIALINSGYRNTPIAEEISNKFDLLESAQDELFKHIEATRREIADFRAQAAGLAELGFSQGYGWPEVFAALEAPGLLTSGDIIQFCVQARDKVKPKPLEPVLA